MLEARVRDQRVAVGRTQLPEKGMSLEELLLVGGGRRRHVDPPLSRRGYGLLKISSPVHKQKEETDKKVSSFRISADAPIRSSGAAGRGSPIRPSRSGALRKDRADRPASPSCGPARTPAHRRLRSSASNCSVAWHPVLAFKAQSPCCGTRCHVRSRGNVRHVTQPAVSG